MVQMSVGETETRAMDYRPNLDSEGALGRIRGRDRAIMALQIRLDRPRHHGATLQPPPASRKHGSTLECTCAACAAETERIRLQ